MKSIKFSALILIALTIFSSCSKEDEKYLHVRFINGSGTELKEIKVGDKDIGTLEAGGTTPMIEFDVFHFDSGYPDEPATAMAGMDTLYDATTFYWCGTEKTFVDEGELEMTLKVEESDGKKYLLLEWTGN